jgi:hypothetical protein
LAAQALIPLQAHRKAQLSVRLSLLFLVRKENMLAEADNVTYVLLSGITLQSNIRLGPNVELQPADVSHLDFNTALATCCHPDDIAVVAAFIPRTTAQFRITADTPKNLAIAAWNAGWDAHLLSVFLKEEVGFNLQSDTTASSIVAESNLSATNHHMNGITNSPPRAITLDESKWLATHFASAQRLLGDDRFQTAVHCLATYRWHAMPRIRLAILWAGIEGLFGASSEIRFRISLYIARYLNPDHAAARQVAFDSVMKLYNTRSAAVHGSKLKGDAVAAVRESADILSKLLVQCTISGSMPDTNKLAP